MEKANILVVEDNLGDAVLIEEYIASSTLIKCSITHLQTLNEAINELNKGAFDAILLDLNLPDSNGLNTLEAIKNLAAESALIVLTGLNDERTGDLALQSGAQDFISKTEASELTLPRAIKYAIARKAEEKKLTRINKILNSIREINLIAPEKYSQKLIIQEICDILQRNSTYHSVVILLSDNKSATHLTSFGFRGSKEELDNMFTSGKNLECLKRTIDSGDIPYYHKKNENCKGCVLYEDNKSSGVLSRMLKTHEHTYGIIWASTSSQHSINLEEKEVFNSLATDISHAIHSVNIIKEQEKLKEEINTSEKKFRFLAENSVDCIWQMNLLLRFKYLSPVIENYFGYKPSEMIGKPLWKYAKRSDFIKMARFALRSIQQPTKYPTVRFESNLLHKNKSIVPVEILGKVLFNKQGKLIGLQGSIREISGRVQAREQIIAKNRELELRNKETISLNKQLVDNLKRIEEINVQLNEEKEKAENNALILKTALGDSPVGIVIAELPDGKISFINRSGLRIHAKEEADLNKVSDIETYIKDWNILDIDNAQIAPDQFPLGYTIIHGKKRTGQYIIRRRENENLIIWAKAAPLLNPKGEQTAAIMVFMDITKRIKAEAEKEKYMKFLDIFVENTPFPTWIADQQGYIIRTNEALRDALQVTNDQVIGKYNILEDENIINAGVIPQVRSVFEQEKVARFMIEWRSDKTTGLNIVNNITIWIDAIVFPLASNDGSNFMIACQWLDVTERKNAHDALKKSKERLIEAQHIAKMGDFIWDLKNNEFSLSDSLCNLFQLDNSNTLTQQDIIKLHHPEDLDMVIQWMNCAIDSTKDILDPLEYRMIRSNNETMWVKSRGIIKKVNGEPVMVISTVQDITESKKVEDEMDSLSKFPSENPNPVIRINTNAEILYVNEAARILINKMSSGESNLLPKEFLEKLNSLTELSGVTNIEITHKNNYYSISVAAIPEKGYINLYGLEITELRNIEKELRWTNYLTDNLLANIPDKIYFKDLESRFLRINTEMARVFNLRSTQDAIGKSDKDFFATEHTDSALRDEKKIIRSGIPIINKEEVEYWPDGTTLNVLTTKMPLKDTNGKIIGTFGITRDITQLKNTEMELKLAKEKAEESDRLKTAFLNNISHEIRTPMNAIIGFSSFLRDPNLENEKRNKYIDLINNSCNQLLSIINDIVNIASIEAGQIKLYKEQVSLKKLCHIIYDQFVLKANAKDIKLVFNSELIDDDLIITTDQSKLRQILTNLVGNAIKFTHKGTVSVSCSQNGKGLKFSIKDTGIGINSALQEKIFERFRQAEVSKERLFGGSGLGLSISKGYIEALGGRIWLESEPSKGSTFYFTISTD